LVDPVQAGEPQGEINDGLAIPGFGTKAPDARAGHATGAARQLVIGSLLGFLRSEKPAIARQSLFVSQINGFSGSIETKMHDFAPRVDWRICGAASEALASVFRLWTRRRIAKPVE
jgi:hypothetical protein